MSCFGYSLWPLTSGSTALCHSSVQWPFPFTYPPWWLCTLLPQQCLLPEPMSHHEPCPPLNCLYSSQRPRLISLGGKFPESGNPVYMTLASHTAPANISRTGHSAQVFSQILSVEYKIASACHVRNACFQVARLFWDVLETQKVAPSWKK